MGSIFSITAILLAAVALWAALARTVQRSATFRNSGVIYFKVLLRQRRVDIAKIPDAALREIVQAKTAAAKKQAIAARLRPSGRAGKNWRINLVRSLEAEANLMGLVMRDGSVTHSHSDALAILQKHGVLRSRKTAQPTGMTLEQFLEATRRGTLYSELSRRRAKGEEIS